MSRIEILPPELAIQIAAGEVVERPASVVKELVENALDAEAKHIRVVIKGAGKELIEVSDNGIGMSRAEVEIAIERHATSKIRTFEDLTKVQTLGFRGEALPSIASVSKMTIETKARDGGGVEGTRLELRGQEVLACTTTGCPVGTRIAARELFYNAPARKKFLKSDAVEVGHIVDHLLALGLGRLDVGFELFVDEKKKFSWIPSSDPNQRLADALGKTLVADALMMEEATPELRLKGWLIHPRQSAHGMQGLYIYLNGRFLRDKVLNHAVVEGYGDFLMKGQYPKAILYLEIDPTKVDVNVHPAKREVRFEKPQVIHQFVAQAVKKALQKEIYSAGSPEKAREQVACSRSVPEPPLTAGGVMLRGGEGRVGVWGHSPKQPTSPRTPICGSDFSGGSLFASGQFSQLKIIGTIASSYILCESPEQKLVLIDQHAAHERIGYEKLKISHKEQRSSSQRLLAPLTWEATPKQAAVLQQNREILIQAGLEVEPFGNNSFVVKSHPAFLPEGEVLHLLEEITEELENLERSNALEVVLDHVFKTMACHQQVRAHDKLSSEELRHLLVEMDEFNATHCPHGRPTYVEVPLNEVAKWFKRT